MKFLCVSVLLCIVVVTNGVQYIDCGKCNSMRWDFTYEMYRPFLTGSKLCKINSVDVTGCAADAQTCNLVRGKSVNMTMKFTTSTYFDVTLPGDNVKRLLLLQYKM